jgi:hypothetical protein
MLGWITHQKPLSKKLKWNYIRRYENKKHSIPMDWMRIYTEERMENNLWDERKERATEKLNKRLNAGVIQQQCQLFSFQLQAELYEQQNNLEQFHCWDPNHCLDRHRNSRLLHKSKVCKSRSETISWTIFWTNLIQPTISEHISLWFIFNLILQSMPTPPK